MRRKYLLFVLTMVISVISLSGCESVKEADLKKPVENYLDERYGFKEPFKFLTWDDNWFEGIDHQTAIEIGKPYHATAYIMLERDTYKIAEERSDNVFFELYKGAYIEQHPEVMKVTEQLIDKYDLMKKSASEYDKMKGNYYYYLNVNLNTKQADKLIDTFSQTQKIDTLNSLPDMSDPLSKEGNRYRGVINFNFDFNIYKQDKDVPQAEDIANDFEKSHVLTEGLYCISVHTIEVHDKGVSQGMDPRNNNVRFKVDRNGEFKNISVLEE
ncbi:hypothetical protein [Paenibacillus sp. FSL M7-1046]|uniref:hypothetical protein n=1 Tax=Paenibacillus sp. FSL M7-1046 TaxID=2975315 RepID=UPI0030FB630F